MKRYIRSSVEEGLSPARILGELNEYDTGKYKIYVNGWVENKKYATELLSNLGANFDDIAELARGEEVTLDSNSFFVEYYL